MGRDKPVVVPDCNAQNGQPLLSGTTLLHEAYSGPRISEDKANFPYHLAAHRAHTVMLVERGIISKEDGKAILVALRSLEEQGAESMSLGTDSSDLFTATIKHLRRSIGDGPGGRLHTGRSRNDLFMALARMRARDRINDISEALIEVLSALLQRAEEHAETLFPGYTHHSQQAQPITFGHFLLGHYDNVQRNLDRLDHAYRQANVSPLGAAALAGTGFPVDRERVAELLGFDAVLEHTADATAGRDFQLDIASTLAILGYGLSLLAESLILYTTQEFSYIELADDYADGSSIMPQKKNPVSLELVEAFAAKANGHLSTMFSILKSTTLGAGREASYCNGELNALFQEMEWATRITSGVVSSMSVKSDRAYQALLAGLFNATEIADALVRTRGISFGQAHDLVGRAIRENSADQALTAEHLNAAAISVVGEGLDISKEEVAGWVDPAGSVEVRSTQGGPARREVHRMITNRKEELSLAQAALEERRSALAAAEERLKKAVNL